MATLSAPHSTVKSDTAREYLTDQLSSSISGVRERRKTIESDMLRNHQSWHSRYVPLTFQPTEASPIRYRIPTARRAIERCVARAVKLATPNQKWYQIQPYPGMQDAVIASVDNYMDFVLRKKIKTRSNTSQLIRCVYLYGRGIQKTAIQVQRGMIWPSQRVVDPFCFYTSPETATTWEDCDFLFEDVLLTYDQYNTYVRKGIGVEPIQLEELEKPDWPYHIIARLAKDGLTAPDEYYSGEGKKIREELERVSAYVSMTEIWLPSDGDLYQAWIVWNVDGGFRIVRFERSQYDEPLYRWAVHRPLPNEAYTNSMMDDIRELQDLGNDQLNQTEDARSIATNPPVALNNQMMGRSDDYQWKPRAKWSFKGEPVESMKMFELRDTSTIGLRAWQITMAMINSLAGAGTMAEGQPGRNMPRAGFAMNQLVNLAMTDIEDIAELVEQEILTPGLGDIYKVTKRFIPPQQMMRIPGSVGVVPDIIRKDDLIGDFEFSWIGSLQFQDTQIRAERLMQFLQMIPQVAPFLQQQGYAFNLPELLKMIWREGLGEKGLSDVVIPLNKLQQYILSTQMINQAMPTGQGGANGSTGSSSGSNGVNGSPNSINGAANAAATQPIGGSLS